MENAQRRPAAKKRRISERVDWLNREVMAVLRMMDGDKSITLSAGSDLIERITGRRVDNATMCRRLRWLRESANSWEKLSSAQLGEGEADEDKQEHDSVETDMEGLYELLYRPKCGELDDSRVRQAIEAEMSGNCVVSSSHNNFVNLASERLVECRVDPAATVSATCDASSTHPLWRRILTWSSESGSAEAQLPIADVSDGTVDEGDRYDQVEGVGFCLKKENGVDPAVVDAESTYSAVPSSSLPQTATEVNCSAGMTDIVASGHIENGRIPSTECQENTDVQMFSEADLVPNEGSSQCHPLPVRDDRPIPTTVNDTNHRRRIMRNSVSGRVSVRDIRRYNVLSKNAAARRIAAESQQGLCRNCLSIEKAQMSCKRHCTDEDDIVRSRSTNSGGTVSATMQPTISGKCKTRSVAVGSDRVSSLRDKRVDDALFAIEGLLSKFGATQRDEFNNLGDSVADCLRGVNRVDTTAAAQFKLELLEMMARYQKATISK